MPRRVLPEVEYLYYLLNTPQVTHESRAVFDALLKGCRNEGQLAHKIHQHVSHGAQENLKQWLKSAAECSCQPCVERRETGHPLHWYAPPFSIFIAEAINDEARRWMSDFWLYPQGKRVEQHRKWKWTACWRENARDHDQNVFERGWERRSMLEEQVIERDGYMCALTGEEEDVVVTQIIPLSQDPGRLARFRALASVYFGENLDELLSEEHLSSTANAFMICEEWENNFDQGGFYLKYFGGKFHVVTTIPGEIHDIREARRKNGLYSPAKLELQYQRDHYREQPIDPRLVKLHEDILLGWESTGLADRFHEENNRIQRIPSHRQRLDVLGYTDFNGVVHHKLAIL